MQLQFVTHEGYADKFNEYAATRQPESDTGVLLTLVNVTEFDRRKGRATVFTFSDGEEIGVPYGEIRRVVENEG
jgi:hypothetical protein